MSQTSTDIASKQFSFPELKCESDKKKKSLHLILLASLLSLTHTHEHGCFLQAWDVRELESDLP